jgi:hypothetical protein
MITCRERTMRGGSWKASADMCRATFRRGSSQATQTPAFSRTTAVFAVYGGRHRGSCSSCGAIPGNHSHFRAGAVSTYRFAQSVKAILVR